MSSLSPFWILFVCLFAPALTAFFSDLPSRLHPFTTLRLTLFLLPEAYTIITLGTNSFVESSLT